MDIIQAIMDKKELRGLDPNYVAKRVDDFFKEYPKIKEKSKDPKFLKSKDFKLMQKEVRAKLREVYGAFILTNYKKLEKAIEQCVKDPHLGNHEKVLKMHRSSMERIKHYDEIYEKIFKITGYPKSILDLACGLNPISYPWLKCETEYIASDISPIICELLQYYFDKRIINGQTFVFDLLDFRENEFSDYLKCDVCFLFKALDSLETIERNFSEKLITGLKCKYIVVSFATKSLGARKTISGERRTWFEKMLKKHELKHDFFSIDNESFYVIKTEQ